MRTGNRSRHVDYGGSRERETSRMLAPTTLGRRKRNNATEGGRRSSVTIVDAERGDEEQEQGAWEDARRERSDTVLSSESSN
jgi:hypothetical protein